MAEQLSIQTDHQDPYGTSSVSNNSASDPDHSKQRAREALRKAAETDPRKTQAALARFLGMSTGAVSKILINEQSHPMTIQFAKGLARYLDLSLDDIFGEHSYFAIADRPTSEPSNSEEAPEAIFLESKDSLEAFFDAQSTNVTRKRLYELAEQVAEEVYKANGSEAPDFQAAIMKVLSRRATA